MALRLLLLAPIMEVASVGSGTNWILGSGGTQMGAQHRRAEATAANLMRAEPSLKSPSGDHLSEVVVLQMMEMGTFRLLPELEHMMQLQPSTPGRPQPAVASMLADGRPANLTREFSRRGHKASRVKMRSHGRNATGARNSTSRKHRRDRPRSMAKKSVQVLPGKDHDPEDPAIVSSEERKHGAKVEAEQLASEVTSSTLPPSFQTVESDELVLPGQPNHSNAGAGNTGQKQKSIANGATNDKAESNTKDSAKNPSKNGNVTSKGSGFQESPDDPSKPTDRDDSWKTGHDSRDAVDDDVDDWDSETENPVIGSTNGTAEDDDDAGDDIFPDSGDVEINDDSVINVTSEQDAHAKSGQEPLKAAESWEPKAPPREPDVMKLGEGIGAMAYERSPTGSRKIDHDLERRLQLQDFATLSMLLFVFTITIVLSCCSVYQVADDPSPAAYYSEPRSYHQRLISETADLDTFLAAFNLQPQNIRLRIIGRNPDPGGFRRFLRILNPHTIRPRGLAALLPSRHRRRLAVLFDVSLDLTPFIAGEGRLNDDNLITLQKYLSSTNSLETVLLQKRVDWVHWEDVATNVRQRLRTLGFPGEVEVHFEAHDEILIYRNHKWSNFVRNRVTQALVVISMVGPFVWLPYVWVRQKKTIVETRFRIHLDPARYWELVSDGLSAADGFHGM